MTAGLHNHRGIYPQLPGCEIDEFGQQLLDDMPETDPFRRAWEFKLSHQLADSEGSAFWHGANAVYQQMRDDPTILTELQRVIRIAGTPFDDITEEDRAWFAEHPLRKGVEFPLSAMRIVAEWLEIRARDVIAAPQAAPKGGA